MPLGNVAASVVYAIEVVTLAVCVCLCVYATVLLMRSLSKFLGKWWGLWFETISVMVVGVAAVVAAMQVLEVSSESSGLLIGALIACLTWGGKDVVSDVLSFFIFLPYVTAHGERLGIFLQEERVTAELHKYGPFNVELRTKQGFLVIPTSYLRNPRYVSVNTPEK